MWHETLLQVLPEKGHQSPLIPTLIRLDFSGGAVSWGSPWRGVVARWSRQVWWRWKESEIKNKGVGLRVWDASTVSGGPCDALVAFTHANGETTGSESLWEANKWLWEKPHDGQNHRGCVCHNLICINQNKQGACKWREISCGVSRKVSDKPRKKLAHQQTQVRKQSHPGIVYCVICLRRGRPIRRGGVDPDVSGYLQRRDFTSCNYHSGHRGEKKLCRALILSRCLATVISLCVCMCVCLTKILQACSTFYGAASWKHPLAGWK